MKKPTFTAQGDASADIVIVGSGVVGGLMANELVSQGYSVLVLEAGLRIDRAQAVENWRNMPFANRAGSDFQGLYPRAPTPPASSRVICAPLVAPPGTGRHRAGVITPAIS